MISECEKLSRQIRAANNFDDKPCTESEAKS